MEKSLKGGVNELKFSYALTEEERKDGSLKKSRPVVENPGV
jgi:hypothetical protein